MSFLTPILALAAPQKTGNALDEGRRNLDLRDFLAFDVLLEQFVVEFRDGLDELLARGLDIRLNVLGDVGDEVLIVVRDDLHVQGQQVDDALKGRFLADGQLDRHDAAAEAHAQFLDDLLEIGVLAVHLVDEERARQLLVGGVLPDLFRLDLDAGRRRDHDECAVSGAQSTLDIAHKVGIARRIDEIQFIVTPFAGGQLHIDGHAALRLFRLMIEQTRLVLDTAEALGCAGIEEAGIEQARLARLAMTDHRDIA